MAIPTIVAIAALIGSLGLAVLAGWLLIRRRSGPRRSTLARVVLPENDQEHRQSLDGDGISHTPESAHLVATRLCDAAVGISGRSAAIVERDPVTQVATVAVASAGVDARLINARVPADSVVGRACIGMLTTATGPGMELLGSARSERRRDRQGVAFPIVAQVGGIGALVVFGPPESLSEPIVDKLTALARVAGPTLDRALRLGAEARQGVTDTDVGLPNRLGLQEALACRAYAPCLLVRVELDQLDRVVWRFFDPHCEPTMSPRIWRAPRLRCSSSNAAQATVMPCWSACTIASTAPHSSGRAWTSS